MSHLSTIDRADQSVCTLDHAEPYVPTAEDWAEVAAWRAATEDPGDFDGPTPLEALVEPCEADDDAEPWWASLPTDNEFLDTPIGLGHEAEPVAIRTRGPRYAIEVNGVPERPADGYAIRDTTTGQVVTRARWFADAERIASELELHAPRSRASWNPEADAIGRS